MPVVTPDDIARVHQALDRMPERIVAGEVSGLDLEAVADLINGVRKLIKLAPPQDMRYFNMTEDEIASSTRRG